MRLMIFAYNPMYINVVGLEILAEKLEKEHNCKAIFVEHLCSNPGVEPIYCVQFCDSL